MATRAHSSSSNNNNNDGGSIISSSSSRPQQQQQQLLLLQERGQEDKALLCLSALCLPKTVWSVKFIRAVGLALQVPESAVDGALTLLYWPMPLQQPSSTTSTTTSSPTTSTVTNDSMLAHAELHAVGLRSTFANKASAVSSLVRLLLILLRGPELAIMEEERLVKLQKQQQQQQPKNTRTNIFQARQQQQSAAAAAAASIPRNEKLELFQTMLRFDSRTSVFLRRVAFLLRIKLATLAALEDFAIRELQKQQQQQQEEADSMTNAVQQQQERKRAMPSKQIVRAMKIGSVAAATGSILFLTGGLAAPVVAGALATFGLTAMSALATTTTVATLLGAGGAGLGAYKMSRRTAGLTRLEFQCLPSRPIITNTSLSSTSKNMDTKGMTVYVCVSGFLRQPGPAVTVSGESEEDTKNNKESSRSSFRRSSSSSSTNNNNNNSKSRRAEAAAANAPDFYAPWGTQPALLLPEQALDRFYSVVAPEKRKLIPFLLEAFAGQEDALLDELARRYHIHPRTLQPIGSPKPMVEQYEGSYLKVLSHGMVAFQHMMRMMTNNAAAGTDNGSDDEQIPRLVLTSEEEDVLLDADTTWSEMYIPPQPSPLVVDTAESNSTTAAGVTNNNTFSAQATATSASSSSASTKDETQRRAEEMEQKMEQERLEKFQEAFNAEDWEDLADEMGRIQLQTSARHDQGGSSSAAAAGGGLDEKEQQSRPPKPGKTDVIERSEVYWWRQQVAKYGDQFTVIWEPETLLSVGQSLDTFVRQAITQGAAVGAAQTLKLTALAAVAAAVAIPLGVANFVRTLDESWVVATEVADKAGKCIAEALLSESHGNRPVVLIGYSVGGRVVASCLSRLAAIAFGSKGSSGSGNNNNSESFHDDFVWTDYYGNDQDNVIPLTHRIENDTSLSDTERKRRLRAATVVRDAVIIGAPCDTSSYKWAQRRSVVLGRLINVYNPSDWVLALLYRYKSWSVLSSLAGLKEIQARTAEDNNHDAKSNKSKTVLLNVLVSQIENFNVSDIVRSHRDYPAKMDLILQRIGIGDVNCQEFHANYFVTP